jgi:hypothetical protein
MTNNFINFYKKNIVTFTNEDMLDIIQFDFKMTEKEFEIAVNLFDLGGIAAKAMEYHFRLLCLQIATIIKTPTKKIKLPIKKCKKKESKK